MPAVMPMDWLRNGGLGRGHLVRADFPDQRLEHYQDPRFGEKGVRHARRPQGLRPSDQCRARIRRSRMRRAWLGIVIAKATAAGRSRSPSSPGTSCRARNSVSGGPQKLSGDDGSVDSAGRRPVSPPSDRRPSTDSPERRAGRGKLLLRRRCHHRIGRLALGYRAIPGPPSSAGWLPHSSGSRACRWAGGSPPTTALANCFRSRAEPQARTAARIAACPAAGGGSFCGPILGGDAANRRGDPARFARTAATLPRAGRRPHPRPPPPAWPGNSPANKRASVWRAAAVWLAPRTATTACTGPLPGVPDSPSPAAPPAPCGADRRQRDSSIPPRTRSAAGFWPRLQGRGQTGTCRLAARTKSPSSQRLSTAGAIWAGGRGRSPATALGFRGFEGIVRGRVPAARAGG